MFSKIHESVSSLPMRREQLNAGSFYLLQVSVANLVWEFAHLPLYTIWQEGSAGTILFAVFHCTIGDLLIATTSLLIALFLVGRSSWPSCHFIQVAIVATLIGLSYTVFSEWLNIEVRQSWAYSPLMPTLPFLGTGLSPLAQWAIIPLASFWLVHRSANKISYS